VEEKFIFMTFSGVLVGLGKHKTGYKGSAFHWRRAFRFQDVSGWVIIDMRTILSCCPRALARPRNGSFPGFSKWQPAAFGSPGAIA
jgi:hypothetical protein